ncbi:MAG: hypothetical protein QM692_21330 [Thermomicrobiales bacterium]
MSGEQKVGASILLALLVWGIGLASAFVATHVPRGDEHYGLTIIPPALAVFLIGVWAANHWWTRGALLIAVPPVVYLVFLFRCALALQESAPGAFARGIAGILVLGICAMVATVAAVVVAALGVWFGRRVR